MSCPSDCRIDYEHSHCTYRKTGTRYIKRRTPSRWGNYLERFWSNVPVLGPYECWPWAGATNACGYGVASPVGGTGLVHRQAWMFSIGPIPPGHQVLHSCDNPPCVNPQHLFLGTQIDNIKDMVSKGRAKGPDSERAKFSKLSWVKVAGIRSAIRSGAIEKQLAEQYGVSESTISDIRNERTWRAGF